MPASFPEIINSRIITFVIGDAAQEGLSEFRVHEDAVAQLSPELKQELHDCQDGIVTWKRVSRRAFEQFIQFAYTGDYSVPGPEKDVYRQQREEILAKLAAAAAAEEPVAEPVDKPVDEQFIVNDWGFGIPSKKDKKDKKGKKGKFSEPEEPTSFTSSPFASPWMVSGPITKFAAKDFKTMEYTLLAPRNNYESTCYPNATFDLNDSYSEVMCSHAALFLIASQYQIDVLKALTLHKLHTTLCKFVVDQINADDITCLVKFVYAHTSDKEEALKDLVCQFMATNAKVLSTNDKFLDLLQEGGPLVKDYISYVAQRV